MVLPAQQLHTPPEGELPSVVVFPRQSASGPEIADGAAFTVTTVDVLHPPMPQTIVAVPATSPVHMPDELTVAIAGTVELQLTPGVALLRVADCPAHKDIIPVIVAGFEFTVSTATARHPDGNVYVIVHVLPPDPAAAVTTPVPSPTDTVPLQLQLHVPPGVACVSVVLLPSQITSVPVGAGGVAFIVTTDVA